MGLIAALIYWVIIAVWLAVLATVGIAYHRNRKTFGTSRLLLIVVAIDTGRNIIENAYFGSYFGAQYGLFPAAIVGVLEHPALLIIPKFVNVLAASIVLSLLLLRWLPLAQREKSNAENDVRAKSDALTQEIEEHRRLFDTSVDVIVVTDRERVITRISASCAALLGYLPEEMIGRYGGDFVSPEFIDLLRSELLASVNGEAVRNSSRIFSTGMVIRLRSHGPAFGRKKRSAFSSSAGTRASRRLQRKNLGIWRMSINSRACPIALA